MTQEDRDLAQLVVMESKIQDMHEKIGEMFTYEELIDACNMARENFDNREVVKWILSRRK